MIGRIRQMLGKTGLVYAGDCKMAALATRADLVAHGDYYLVPLPVTGEIKDLRDGGITAATEGDQVAQLLWDGGQLLGGGYEWERSLSAVVGDRTVTWTERVQVIRSRSLAQAQDTALEQRLRQAEVALGLLTPPPGRGQRSFEEAASLEAAIAASLQHHDVIGLLQVCWRRDEQTRT